MNNEVNSESSIGDLNQICKTVKLAVFDFDGTCISGNSPVLLVKNLAYSKGLKPFTVFKIMLWGLFYKLHLPQNESWVRGLVFSAFEGMSKKDVDMYLSDFYDTKVEPRFRDSADKQIQWHLDRGHVVIAISATFEPILLRAIEKHGFQYGIATRMRVDGDGKYTRFVDGNPIEGDEKLVAMQKFANEKFGPNNWEIAYAYGDHYSDKAILSAAKCPNAVTPDSSLEKYAKDKCWNILYW